MAWLLSSRFGENIEPLLLVLKALMFPKMGFKSSTYHIFFELYTAVLQTDSTYY